MVSMVGVTASCVASGLVDPICQGVNNVGSSIVSDGASAIFDSMSTWVGSGSAWLLGQIGSALNTSTTVSLDAPWFLARYHAAEAILGVVALPLLLMTAIQALFQQRPALLLRAAFVQLPLAMVFAGAAVELTTMAMSISDELSNALSTTSPGAVQSLMQSIASILVSSSAASGSSVPAFIALLGAVIVAVAALALWVELVIRTAAIYVAVAFLPLVLISMVWPSLASWSRRLTETLLALILSKLVVVAVLEMAVGALGSQQDGGFATIVTGIALLTLAAFAPFSLFRLLPMFESSAALALEGLRQRGTQTVLHGAPRQAASLAMGMAGRTPPLGLSLMNGSMGQKGGGLSSHVGEQSTEDPMATSAIASASGSGSSPVVPSTASSSEPPAATDRSAPPSRMSGDLERGRTARSRPHPSLYLDHDELGPLIRKRPQDPKRADGQ